MSLRHSRPHLRCGLCDQPIDKGEQTAYVDDERCHADCAQGDSFAHYDWTEEYDPPDDDV